TAHPTTSPSSASDWIVADRSRIKQLEIAAHSSGRSGGDKRVFDWPAVGVLQIIATATGSSLSRQAATDSARVRSKYSSSASSRPTDSRNKSPGHGEPSPSIEARCSIKL